MDGLLNIRRRDVVMLVVVAVGGFGFFGYVEYDIQAKRAYLDEKVDTHSRVL